MAAELNKNLNSFKTAVDANRMSEAGNVLQTLKKQLIMLDSLPPICGDYPGAVEERNLAREVYEYAVLYAVKCKDKDDFQRYISCLRPFYALKGCSESPNKPTILGLKLLHLLVENRLSEYHCEIELMSEAELSHPHVSFCTQIERHIMIGSYEQVLQQAQNPPVPHYDFFVSSLLETVRLNVAECVQSAYVSLPMKEAVQLLMFSSEKETARFVEENYPHWSVGTNGLIEFSSGKSGNVADTIPSHKVIEEVLTYAAELERIV